MNSKTPRANPEPSASDGREVSIKLSADDMALIERALSGGMSGRVHGEQEAECLDAYSALREGVVPASPAPTETFGDRVAILDSHVVELLELLKYDGRVNLVADVALTGESLDRYRERNER